MIHVYQPKYFAANVSIRALHPNKVSTTGYPSSHTRLASPEVVDRGLAESVLEPSIGVGTFKKDFFCLTQV